VNLAALFAALSLLEDRKAKRLGTIPLGRSHDVVRLPQ
jgi:hypothetical protein